MAAQALHTRRVVPVNAEQKVRGRVQGRIRMATEHMSPKDMQTRNLRSGRVRYFGPYLDWAFATVAGDPSGISLEYIAQAHLGIIAALSDHHRETYPHLYDRGNRRRSA